MFRFIFEKQPSTNASCYKGFLHLRMVSGASRSALSPVKACTRRAPQPSNMRAHSQGAFALHGVSFHSGLSGGISGRFARCWWPPCACSPGLPPPLRPERTQVRRVEGTTQCARTLRTRWLPSAHAHVDKATHSLAVCLFCGYFPTPRSSLPQCRTTEGVRRR